MTLLLLGFSVVIGVAGLIRAPQGSWGPRGVGLALISVMSLLVQVIPQPDVTTIVLLVFGPIALIAYLVFMWWWRKTHKAPPETCPT